MCVDIEAASVSSAEDMHGIDEDEVEESCSSLSYHSNDATLLQAVLQAVLQAGGDSVAGWTVFEVWI